MKSADEFVGGSKTSLPDLTTKYLKILTPPRTPMCSPIHHHTNEAFTILRLIDAMNIIPLVVQLTQLCGNLMKQSFNNRRTVRVEYMLMHAFHAHGCLIPNRRFRDRVSYTGGLVLTPVSGVYHTRILYLDYRSLYPSIVQEYGLDFFMSSIDILPSTLGDLLTQRRIIKATPPTDPDHEQQLNTHQTALKLAANSIYGCLGSSSCLFFSPEIASRIAELGRIHLQMAIDTTQKLGYSVIAGDTDSIMVDTKLVDIANAMEISDRIRAAVNKDLKFMELELDDMFTDLILMPQKKKYAVLLRNGNLDQRGMDRADQSKFVSQNYMAVIRLVLSLSDPDSIKRSIRRRMKTAHQRLVDNTVPLSSFIITQRLSKHLSQYDSTKPIPHVNVARQMGRDVCPGSYIPYVIVENRGVTITEKAIGIEELLNCSSKSEEVCVDLNWYEQKMHKAVSEIYALL